MVGCIYYEGIEKTPEAHVLIDPLIPAHSEEETRRFWEFLDRRLHRHRVPLAILVANRHHGRNAQRILDRYRGTIRAEIWAPSQAKAHLAFQVTKAFEPGDALPGGIQGFFIAGLDNAETAFYFPSARALVFADAVIGTGGGEVRVAPASWADESAAGQQAYAEKFRPSLQRLLELEIDLILPSHGEPVTSDGSAALARALESPAWGETASS